MESVETTYPVALRIPEPYELLDFVLEFKQALNAIGQLHSHGKGIRSLLLKNHIGAEVPFHPDQFDGCPFLAVRTLDLDGGCAGFDRLAILGVVEMDRYLRALNRKALLMTETELRLIAAPAMIGLSSKPKNG